MDYNVRNVNGVAEIRLNGQLTFEDHPAFRGIMELADNMRGGRIVLDLSALEFIDSSGLGMFALLKEAAENNNVGISIYGAGGLVLRLLMLVKFDAVIPFAGD